MIPKDNEADLEDLARGGPRQAEVSPVEDLAQALAVTLRNTTLQEGRLFFGAGPDAEPAKVCRTRCDFSTRCSHG